MKNRHHLLAILLWLCLLPFALNSQNVGIGQTFPSAKLHITPDVGLPPLIVENLSPFTMADSSFMMINQINGMAKYGTKAQIKQLLNLNIDAENGLTLDQQTIKLGGALITETTVSLLDFNMLFDLDGLGQFKVLNNGLNAFSVLDNGRVVVGGVATSGTFNVNGNSFFGDDLWLRKGTATGLRLARIYDDANDGALELYGTGISKVQFHANDDSYITGGNLGIGTVNPSATLDVDGNVEISSLAGVGNRMVITTTSGELSSQAIPTGGVGDITDVIAGDGLSGGSLSGSASLDVNAGNGLTTNGASDQVELGGTLSQNTAIDFNGNTLTHDLTNGGDVKVYAGATNFFNAKADGTVAIGAETSVGAFNVTGASYFTDELTVRNTTVNGNDIMRVWKFQDNGVLDLVDGTTIKSRINSNGISYLNGGNVGINITGPTARLDVNGDLRIRNVPSVNIGSGDDLLSTDSNGNVRKIIASQISPWTRGAFNIFTTETEVGIGTSLTRAKLDMAVNNQKPYLLIGSANNATGKGTVVIGNNDANDADYSMIFGLDNIITGAGFETNHIFGDQNNVGAESVNVFGTQNVVNSPFTTVFGRVNQVIASPLWSNSFISGSGNISNSARNVRMFGENNSITSNVGSSVLGSGNSINGFGFNLVSGRNNVLEDCEASVLGVSNNVTNFDGLVVGEDNSCDYFSTLQTTSAIFGDRNIFNYTQAPVGGGKTFLMGDDNTFNWLDPGNFDRNYIFGFLNTFTGVSNAYTLGTSNTVQSATETYTFGNNNTIAGFANYTLGYQNSISGARVISLGYNNTNTRNNVFVFGKDLNTLNDNYGFYFKSANGYVFYTNPGQTSGVSLAFGSGTWTSLSDRHMKEDFQTLNYELILEKVVAMPVTRWKYKSQEIIEHIGPMAQDFYAAFGVGKNDKGITTVDADGVNMAAIKGLNMKVEKYKSETKLLKEKNHELETEVEDLKIQMKMLYGEIEKIKENMK